MFVFQVCQTRLVCSHFPNRRVTKAHRSPTPAQTTYLTNNDRPLAAVRLQSRLVWFSKLQFRSELIRLVSCWRRWLCERLIFQEFSILVEVLWGRLLLCAECNWDCGRPAESDDCFVSLTNTCNWISKPVKCLVLLKLIETFTGEDFPCQDHFLVQSRWFSRTWGSHRIWSKQDCAQDFTRTGNSELDKRIWIGRARVWMSHKTHFIWKPRAPKRWKSSIYTHSWPHF